MRPSTPSACLNCGTAVDDAFCPRCGQKAEDRRGPLRRLLADFFGEVFSLESRLFRGLRDLFFRPGRLTEGYQAGKRASQLPPLRLYLVASLFFFFLFSLTPPDVSDANVFVGDQVIGREEPDPDASGNVRFDFEPGPGNPFWWLEPRMEKQQEKFRQMEPQVLIDAVYHGIASALPKALILFLPILAFVLKLLFLRSGILYFDHFIFALHLQSFLFCLFSVSWFVPVPAVYWLVFFVVVAPVYLVLAMRRVYRQGWIRILLKTAILVFVYLFVLAMVFFATLLWVMSTI
jgi:hypothetical protein